MKYNERARKLKRLGCAPTRFGAGPHEIWRNARTGLQATVPYHRTQDIGPGLLARILRQLGIDRDEFDNA
jgi:predicted RNA binding protein YcfA (HicA-like mRNA interferase family)